MLGKVVLVYDERAVRDDLSSALRDAGLDVSSFSDPSFALAAIEVDEASRILITRIDFGPGKQHGVSLSWMARLKRPGLRAVFIDREELRDVTDQGTTFLPTPVDASTLVNEVAALLGTPGR
jgi:DNA-binding NtrC family response regulator